MTHGNEEVGQVDEEVAKLIARLAGGEVFDMMHKAQLTALHDIIVEAAKLALEYRLAQGTDD